MPAEPVDRVAPEPLDRTVLVFFPHMEATAEDFTAVRAVERTTDREDVAAYAMEQLIAGPTERERADGFYTELRFLPGESTCGGADFRLGLEDGHALVQVCRFPEQFHTTGGDAAVTGQIRRTLEQFRTVERVHLLDPEMRCYGDRSGEDRCLGEIPPRLLEAWR
jgi:hypothetical protein